MNIFNQILPKEANTKHCHINILFLINSQESNLESPEWVVLSVSLLQNEYGLSTLTLPECKTTYSKAVPNPGGKDVQKECTMVYNFLNGPIILGSVHCIYTFHHSMTLPFDKIGRQVPYQ